MSIYSGKNIEVKKNRGREICSHPTKWLKDLFPSTKADLWQMALDTGSVFLFFVFFFLIQ